MQPKSVNQFCAKYGISRATFYAEVRRGRLRVFKVGRCTRVSSDAEADYVAQGEQRFIDEAPEASARARARVSKRKLAETSPQ